MMMMIYIDTRNGSDDSDDLDQRKANRLKEKPLITFNELL